LIFIIGFFWEVFYYLGLLSVTLLCVIALYDIFQIYFTGKIAASRIVPEKLSNGDDNMITIRVISQYKKPMNCEIIDELPFQFQKRNFSIIDTLHPNVEHLTKYDVKPVERGDYQFGSLNIYITSSIALSKRRFIFSNDKQVKVYPSFIQMKYYSMMAISNKLVNTGIKEVRKLGHSMEFEHVRDYRVGDDYRTMNWKATARRNSLMVNQYIDERSQNVYQIIDTGRNMKMPFAGMTLLDYSINTALALSSIIMKKYDKSGLVTFSDKVHTFIPALNNKVQFTSIAEALYNIQTDFAESSFENLYSTVRRKISQRSLLIIYTNFESKISMRRNIDYLKLLTRFHLPLVIFFDNTEISSILKEEPQKIFDVYKKVSAERHMIEKYEIVNELKSSGIMSFFTKPESLTVDSVNKYLEIKSRRKV
jgi:uncharacterized protein (DUF58 family)